MSHIMWELAMEIKEGQFSTMLLRPMSFYQLNFFRNLSWRVIRPILFAPFFVLLLFAYRGFLTHAEIHLGWEFWASVAMGHLVSFTFVMMMAMLALFTQEVSSIFELYYIPMLFLSGQLCHASYLGGQASQAVSVLFHDRSPHRDPYRTHHRPCHLSSSRNSSALGRNLLRALKGTLEDRIETLHRCWNVG